MVYWKMPSTKVTGAVIASASLLAFVGCSNLNQAVQATGALDQAMLVTGFSKPDIVPVEARSSAAGAIVSARAVARHGGLFIYGSVQRQLGSGIRTSAGSRVEISILDAQGKVLESIKTNIVPQELPARTSRFDGESHFSAQFRRMPLNGSKAVVVFQNKSLAITPAQ